MSKPCTGYMRQPTLCYLNSHDLTIRKRISSSKYQHRYKHSLKLIETVTWSAYTSRLSQVSLLTCALYASLHIVRGIRTHPRDMCLVPLRIVTTVWYNMLISKEIGSWRYTAGLEPILHGGRVDPSCAPEELPAQTGTEDASFHIISGIRTLNHVVGTTCLNH